MKNILFLFLIVLFCSHCATKRTYLSSWESQEFNSTLKKVPSILINPGLYHQGYFRDSNGTLQTLDGNMYLMNMDSTDSYFHMVRRNKNLPESKFIECNRLNEEYRIPELSASRGSKMKSLR